MAEPEKKFVIIARVVPADSSEARDFTLALNSLREFDYVIKNREEEDLLQVYQEGEIIRVELD